MKKIFLVFIFLLFCNATYSANEVGGDISISYRSDGSCIFNLNISYDFNVVYYATTLKSITTYIYTKNGNQLIDTVKLYLKEYTTFEADSVCKYLPIKTVKLSYVRIKNIDPATYSNSGGIYAMYQNGGPVGNYDILNNINNPKTCNVVLYSEFPPYTMHDNSPVFSNNNEKIYTCLREPVLLDFSAADADGDSLAYELAIPLNYSTSLSTIAGAVPFPNMELKPGFSQDSLIPGIPAFQINSTTGKINFSPKAAGTFMFTVICKQFRQGSYIGQVRRLSQLTVVQCQENTHSRTSLTGSFVAAANHPPDTIKLYFNYFNHSYATIVASLPGQSLSYDIYTIEPKNIDLSYEVGTIGNTGSYWYNGGNVYNDTASIRIVNAACIFPLDTIVKAALVVKVENQCTIPVADTTIFYVKHAEDIPKPNLLYFFRDEYGNKIQEGDSLFVNSCYKLYIAKNHNFWDYYWPQGKINGSAGIGFSLATTQNPTLLDTNTYAVSSFCIPKCASNTSNSLNIFDITVPLYAPYKFIPFFPFYPEWHCLEYNNDISIRAIVVDTISDGVNYFITNESGQKFYAGDTLMSPNGANACYKLNYVGKNVAKQSFSVKAYMDGAEEYLGNPYAITNTNDNIADTLISSFCPFSACDTYNNTVLNWRANISRLWCTTSTDSINFYLNPPPAHIGPQKNTFRAIDPVDGSAHDFSSPVLSLKYADNLRSYYIDVLTIDSIKDEHHYNFSATPLNFSDYTYIQSNNTPFTQSVADTSSYRLTWFADCIHANDSVLKILVKVSTYDSKYCKNRTDSDTLYVKNPNATVSPHIISDIPKDGILVVLGESKTYNVTATGNANVRLMAKNIPPNSVFTPKSANAKVSSPFQISALCEMLRGAPYEMVFVASDSSCASVKRTEYPVNVTVRDSSTNVNAPNVITPNNDLVNDYFDISTFPIDDCLGSFEYVEIFNRWGKSIFYSHDRNFKWLATDMPDGIYYYVVNYSNADYKSWIMVQR